MGVGVGVGVGTRVGGITIVVEGEGDGEADGDAQTFVGSNSSLGVGNVPSGAGQGSFAPFLRVSSNCPGGSVNVEAGTPASALLMYARQMRAGYDPPKNPRPIGRGRRYPTHTAVARSGV